MENKYSFQEIDNEIRDSYLRTSQVFDERNKLRDNWNSLFEYAKQQLEKAFDKVEQDTWKELLDKMNELEGVSDEKICSECEKN